MRRRFRPAPCLRVAVLGALLALPAAAQAQGQGADPRLRAILDACPPRGGAPGPGAVYHPPAWLMRGHKAPPAGHPADAASLEASVRQLPRADPARADVLFALGDAYLDRAARGPAAARGDERRRAVKILAVMIRNHPDHQRGDHALQLLAHGLSLEAASQQEPARGRLHQQARRVYLQLIKRHPTSPFVPHGYTYFADYYFDEGDMDTASRFYERVTSFPPRGNPLHPYATYRLGWCAANRGDRPGAMGHFHSVVRYAAAHPDAPEAPNLARHAQDALCHVR